MIRTEKTFIIHADNYETHRELLERGPCIRSMDLALSCGLLQRMSPWEIETTRVTWEMLKGWDMSPEELFRMGEIHSKRELQPVIEPMQDVLKGFFVEEFLESAGAGAAEQAMERAEQAYNELFGRDSGASPEIYVLSNELRIGGAAVVFYSDVLGYFSESIGDNLILLPSSIHEWLILPEKPGYDLAVLEEMVREANSQVVSEEEILSNHVYRYSLKDKQLSIWTGEEAQGMNISKTLDKRDKNC